MSIRDVLQLNLGILKQQVEQVADDQMCVQPSGLVNHAAWNLGHLAVTADVLGRTLGIGEPVCPASWPKKFGIGSMPTDDASVYPNKATLLTTLEKAFLNAIEIYENTDASILDALSSVERLRDRFGTNGNFAMMLLTSHMGMHIGQISAWRRAMGFASMF